METFSLCMPRNKKEIFSCRIPNKCSFPLLLIIAFCVCSSLHSFSFYSWKTRRRDEKKNCFTPMTTIGGKQNSFSSILCLSPPYREKQERHQKRTQGELELNNFLSLLLLLVGLFSFTVGCFSSLFFSAFFFDLIKF